MTIQLTEKAKIISALAPVNAASGAWVSKPIHMSTINRVDFVISMGAIDSTGTITVEKGTSSSLGTAIAFNYRVASTGAAAFSVLDGALTAIASTGIVLGTTVAAPSNKILAITVLANELGTSDWVGVKCGGSGSANYVSIVAIGYDERYGQAIPPTIIA